MLPHASQGTHRSGPAPPLNLGTLKLDRLMLRCEARIGATFGCQGWLGMHGLSWDFTCTERENQKYKYHHTAQAGGMCMNGRGGVTPGFGNCALPLHLQKRTPGAVCPPLPPLSQTPPVPNCIIIHLSHHQTPTHCQSHGPPKPGKQSHERVCVRLSSCMPSRMGR